MKKFALLAAVPAALVAGPASAAGTSIDFSPLTSNISVADTTAAILSVGGIIVMLTLAVMGVRKIISMVRGA